MTHPSVNSIVERLLDPRYCGQEAMRQEAATIISELQAERDDLLAKCSALLWAIPDDVAGKITSGQLASLRDRAKELLAAESSLSRIKSETVEACAKVAENYRPFGKMQHHGTRRGIASAIRSLSTDDSEKTAESKHSPSTQNTRTE